MADAQVTLVGTLGADPELRYTQSAKAVASFGMAVRRAFKVNDKWEETTTWWNVTAWEGLAENVAASLHKGHRVIVTGVPEQREYERKDGTKGMSLEVRVDAIGVDLKWQRVEVEKIEREKNYKDGTTTSSRAADPKFGEEEPFVSLGEHDLSFRNLHLEV